MKKKIGAILLVVALVVSLGLVTAAPMAAAKGVTLKPPNGLHWDVNFVTQLAYNQPLFSDDFIDSNTDGWTEVGSGGDWGVEYDPDFGSSVYSQSDTDWTSTSTYDTYWRSYGGDSWTNYSVEAKVKIVSGGFAPIAGIFFRVQGTDLSSGYYMFRIDARAGQGPGLIKSPNSLVQMVVEPAVIGTIYTLKVIVNGSNIQCYVDGVKKIDYMDVSSPYLSGGIGVGSFNADVHFDDVNVMGVDPNQILIPLNGTGYVQWTFGSDFQVVDNDANVYDGDKSIVQFPWNMNMYVWWLSARGKPGTIEVVNDIIGDGHTTWLRSKGAPTWIQWPGTYSWKGGVNGHVASLDNNGVTNLALRVYPNQ